MPDYAIAPSILSADFARLGEEVDAVLKAGADIVHFDVMDNHYVPNLTIGPLICDALRKHGVTAPIDVHLMVKPVDRIIPDFAKAGATYITFHPEASEHVDRSLALVRDSGCKSGLVFNPATPLDYLKYVLDKVDPAPESDEKLFANQGPIDPDVRVSSPDDSSGPCGVPWTPCWPRSSR